jgi:hypothetical protein
VKWAGEGLTTAGAAGLAWIYFTGYGVGVTVTDAASGAWGWLTGAGAAAGPSAGVGGAAASGAAEAAAVTRMMAASAKYGPLMANIIAQFDYTAPEMQEELLTELQILIDFYNAEAGTPLN